MRGVAVATVFWTLGLSLLGYWVGSRVGRAAVLYESGVAVRDRTSVRAWSFDALAAVTVERVLRRTSFRVYGLNVGETEREEHKYVVTDAAGGRFVLDEWLTRVEGVGTVVEDQVAARMQPRIVAAFQAGSAVPFGVVEISISDGLRLYGRSIPWHVVNGLGLANGQLLSGSRTAADQPFRSPRSPTRRCSCRSSAPCANRRSRASDLVLTGAEPNDTAGSTEHRSGTQPGWRCSAFSSERGCTSACSTCTNGRRP